MIDRVSLQLGDVLEGVKDKSIEQKYGYLQAAYCDLGDYYEAQLARKDALIREMLYVLLPLDTFAGLLSKEGASWNQGTMVDLYVKTQAFLNRPEVKELLKEGK